MIVCPNCETPVDGGLDVCPYCEESLEPYSVRSGHPDIHGERRGTQAIVTVNLKKGNPITELALDRLDAAISSHRARGTPVLKLIHGYGSKGLGGAIRNVVRDRLEHLRYDHKIRDFIHGEDLGWVDLSRLPSSYRPEPPDVGNHGITIVILN